jgi:hypothetical protein
VVTIAGTSTGTLSAFGEQALRRQDGSLLAPNELQGPAIWSAFVDGSLIAQWRVYGDTPELRDALGIPASPSTV